MSPQTLVTACCFSVFFQKFSELTALFSPACPKQLSIHEKIPRHSSQTVGGEKPSQVTSLHFAGSTRIRNKAIVTVKQKGSKTVLLILQGRGADRAHLFPLRQMQISASSTLKEAFASMSALPNPTTVHPRKVTVALLQRNLSTARADTPQLCLQHCQGKDMPHTLIPHPPHRGVPPQEGAIAGSFCPHQPEALQ